MRTATMMLKRQGLKATSQRRAILNTILAHGGPISAEDIVNSLQLDDPTICLSTVYRNLNLFTDKELLNRLQLDHHRAHYEIAISGHHHHLVCLKCHHVQELSGCPLNNIDTAIIAETGFQSIKHRLTFYGYCPSCQELNANCKTG